MKIRDVIATINEMQSDGIIDHYAVGGAVGATFYLEPVATLDVDVFVSFQPEPGSFLISPQPVFDYLTRSMLALRIKSWVSCRCVRYGNLLLQQHHCRRRINAPPP